MMTDRGHGLPVAKQVQALGIGRGSVYYRPRERDLAEMRRMDELQMNYRFAGARMLCGLLIGEDFAIGRKHVDTLRRKMGLSAIYLKHNTSKPEPGHKTYPFLLRQTLERAKQGLPMAKGFVLVHLARYWTGIHDRCSRGVCRSPWRRRSASKP
jgi:putative transposase